jgi:hypothetical protein
VANSPEQPSKFALTDQDRDLLRKHLPFYEALASGARAPTTVSQEVFVKVVRGKLPAITPHEQAYLKFLKVSQSFGERSNPQAAAAMQPREAQRLSPEPEVGKAHQDPQPGPESPRAPADSPFAPLPPQEPPKMVGPASLKEVLGFDPYSEEPPRVYDASHPSDEESAGPSQGWYSREDYKKFHRRYP